MLYNLAKKQPEYAAEAVAHYLDRLCAVTRAQGIPHPFKDRNSRQLTDYVLKQIGAAAPGAFLLHVLPRIVKLVLDNAVVEEDGRTTDSIWPYRIFRGHSLDHVLLDTIADAMGRLAKVDPSAFEEITAGLETHPHATIAYLLMRGWAGNGPRYADRAAEYLLADRCRLDVGYDMWSEGNGHAAVSRQLLEAITPDCDEAILRRLEAAIFGYVSPRETEPRWRGMTELSLLRSIRQERLSQRAVLRIEELERKFPGIRFAPPEDRGARWVGSPIPAEKATLMTDEQWIGAMRHYSGEPFDPTRGGPNELARVLQAETKQNPRRFATLAARLGDDINPVFFEGILYGLEELIRSQQPGATPASPPDMPVDAETLAGVIRRMHGLPGRPCGRSICWVLQHVGDWELPDDLVKVVSHYAINDPDPRQELWRVSAPQGGPYHGANPHNFGINTVRGAAASALSKLLFGSSARYPALEDAIAALVEDPSLGVRSCAVEALLPVLNFNPDRATDQFVQLCDGADAILGTAPVDMFLHYAVYRAYPKVRPILQRMLLSDDEDTVKIAARQTCVVALTRPECDVDAERLRRGDVATRLAAADIYAHNLSHPAVGQRCSGLLAPFFQDPEQLVRAAASNCFYRMEGVDLQAYKPLIRAFIESPAFEDDPSGLLHALDESTEQLPDFVFAAAERVLTTVRSGAVGGPSRLFDSSYSIATLVIRLYEQSRVERVRTRCLDLIDEMARNGLPGIGREMAKLDR